MNSWYGGQPLGLGIGTVIGFSLIAAVILIITIVLKGYALWHAARRSEKWWFIILLVINTMGILELIYLLFVVGKWHSFKEYTNPTTSNQSNPGTDQTTTPNPTPTV